MPFTGHPPEQPAGPAAPRCDRDLLFPAPFGCCEEPCRPCRGLAQIHLRESWSFMLDVKRNLTTIMDFYELTMAAGYLEEGYEDKISVFDMFFRKIPDGGGFAIMAGLDTFIDAVENLKFTQEDIDYLRGHGEFNARCLDYLSHVKLH